VDRPSARTQRHTRALRDVAYLIEARIQLMPNAKTNSAKYRDQFRRRVRSGRCFMVPYLGCREFPAWFGPPDRSEKPINVTQELGPMLLAIDYSADGSGRGTPRFFDAVLERGVVRVPNLPLTW
jgi:CRISPR-associated protein Cas5d